VSEPPLPLGQEIIRRGRAVGRRRGLRLDALPMKPVLRDLELRTRPPAILDARREVRGPNPRPSIQAPHFLLKMVERALESFHGVEALGPFLVLVGGLLVAFQASVEDRDPVRLDRGVKLVAGGTRASMLRVPIVSRRRREMIRRLEGVENPLVAGPAEARDLRRPGRAKRRGPPVLLVDDLVGPVTAHAADARLLVHRLLHLGALVHVALDALVVLDGLLEGGEEKEGRERHDAAPQIPNTIAAVSINAPAATASRRGRKGTATRRAGGPISRSSVAGPLTHFAAW